MSIWATHVSSDGRHRLWRHRCHSSVKSGRLYCNAITNQPDICYHLVAQVARRWHLVSDELGGYNKKKTKKKKEGGEAEKRNKNAKENSSNNKQQKPTEWNSKNRRSDLENIAGLFKDYHDHFLFFLVLFVLVGELGFFYYYDYFCYYYDYYYFWGFLERFSIHHQHSSAISLVT